MKVEIKRIPNIGVIAEITHKKGIDYVTPTQVVFDDDGVREEYYNRWASLYYLRIVELLPNDDYFPVLRRGLKKYLQFISGKRTFVKDAEIAFLIEYLRHT